MKLGVQKRNDFIDYGSYITLVAKTGEEIVVDSNDYCRVKDFRGFVEYPKNLPIIKTRRNGKMIQIHQLLLQVWPGFEVDHIDGDRFNNRQYNFRLVTRTQNNGNRKKSLGLSSRFKGVTWRKDTKKWQSQINFEHNHYTLGSFISEIEAAQAYDEKARELFGEYGRYNFPQVGEQSTL